LVVDDSVSGPLIVNPEDSDDTDSLQGVPGDVIVARIAEQVSRLDLTVAPSHVGLAMPGIIRGGVVEDSPNLAQLKGLQMQTLITDVLAPQIGKVPVSIINDADAMAAGMAAARGHLDRLIRLWF
jgi:glucokinase